MGLKADKELILWCERSAFSAPGDGYSHLKGSHVDGSHDIGGRMQEARGDNRNLRIKFSCVHQLVGSTLRI